MLKRVVQCINLTELPTYLQKCHTLFLNFVVSFIPNEAKIDQAIVYYAIVVFLVPFGSLLHSKSSYSFDDRNMTITAILDLYFEQLQYAFFLLGLAFDCKNSDCYFLDNNHIFLELSKVFYQHQECMLEPWPFFPLQQYDPFELFQSLDEKPMDDMFKGLLKIKTMSIDKVPNLCTQILPQLMELLLALMNESCTNSVTKLQIVTLMNLCIKLCEKFLNNSIQTHSRPLLDFVCSKLENMEKRVNLQSVGLNTEALIRIAFLQSLNIDLFKKILSDATMSLFNLDQAPKQEQGRKQADTLYLLKDAIQAVECIHPSLSCTRDVVIILMEQLLHVKKQTFDYTSKEKIVNHIHQRYTLMYCISKKLSKCFNPEWIYSPQILNAEKLDLKQNHSKLIKLGYDFFMFLTTKIVIRKTGKIRIYIQNMYNPKNIRQAICQQLLPVYDSINKYHESQH